MTEKWQKNEQHRLSVFRGSGSPREDKSALLERREQLVARVDVVADGERDDVPVVPDFDEEARVLVQFEHVPERGPARAVHALDAQEADARGGGEGEFADGLQDEHRLRVVAAEALWSLVQP